ASSSLENSDCTNGTRSVPVINIKEEPIEMSDQSEAYGSNEAIVKGHENNSWSHVTITIS
ncbi:electroneutral sodium bicarbonate exchanger 1-like isoform X1, partial [Biomphalaria pfeifferi]